MKVYWILLVSYILSLSIIYIRQKKIILIIEIKKYNHQIMILEEKIIIIKNKLLEWKKE